MKTLTNETTKGKHQIEQMGNIADVHADVHADVYADVYAAPFGN
jgi:hypothetical protein